MDYLPKEKKQKKPTGNVKVAEPASQNSSDHKAPVPPVDEQAGPILPKEPTVEPLIEIPVLDQKTIEGAKAFNIPLEKLFDGLNKINAFYALHTRQMAEIHQGFKKLEQVLPVLAQKVEMAQPNPQAQAPGQMAQPQGGGGLGQILSLIKDGSSLLKGQGEEDFLMQQLKREMVESWKGDRQFSKMFQNLTLAKMAGAEAKELQNMIVKSVK